jgi:hypothetical protein
MTRTSIYGAGGLVLLAVWSGAAHAEGTASGGLGISASVPEVCELSTTSAALDHPAGATTLLVQEMCNSARGFQVVASHRPLSEEELVQLDYAGQANLLSPSGFSELAVRSGPRFEQVPVQIQSAGLRSGLVISLGLTMF